ncbi:hypothetical protein [Streptomyces sp. NBC_01565]|uniref:hypothetical protein n=1 Tax=unclassified Streptomyces TaxID=2593676 RepID=UPI0022531633|nr:hypothetical protein [Streptomyces sp. NBC_01565]MCX4546770.1 hypothetical protein [Streptomyces sp. NBC_01565]
MSDDDQERRSADRKRRARWIRVLARRAALGLAGAVGAVPVTIAVNWFVSR